ncbi:hypothetical protein AAG612_10230 [Citromicrobium bathyomarinum]|uniref:hypothetical protein n=1 Tax=Citromicrobium bathyomarinum TaxID=72174 RepID=UPI00315B0783
MATKNNTTSLSIAEMREFAGFSPCEQRFIRRNLDIGLGRCDAFKLWARNASENVAIRRQYVAYQDLKAMRHAIPDAEATETVGPFIGQLSRLAAFDLSQERLDGFSPFRFLYERLLGADIRPWLPSAFCAGAAMPHLRPARRKILLQSLSEAAATAPAWSSREPTFMPEYVDLEEAA